MRHWSTRLNTSLLFFRAWKCFVGFSDGFRRFAIANLPVLVVFDHSCCHNFVIVLLILHLVLEHVVLYGIWQLFDVASFARKSALSLPGMSLWLGHHMTVTLSSG